MATRQNQGIKCEFPGSLSNSRVRHLTDPAKFGQKSVKSTHTGTSAVTCHAWIVNLDMTGRR